MCKLRDRRVRYADSAVLEFSTSLPLQGRWLTIVSYIIAHTEPRFQHFAEVSLPFVCASLTTGRAKNVQKV